MNDAYIDEYPLTMIQDDQIVQPAFSSNMVPIVLSSSNVYIPYCAVTIKSILEHISLEYNYDIFILTTGIDRDQQNMLFHMVNPYSNVSLRLVDMTSFVSKYQFFKYEYISAETYFRLTTPWIFTCFDRIIFLDSDIIVCRDIASLISIDLEGYFLAASKDIVMAGYCNGRVPEMSQYLSNRLKLEKTSDYFNAGVICFNAALMRNTFSADELPQDAEKGKYTILDQDTLNRYCNGKVYYLGLEWNMPPDCNVFSDIPRERKSHYISYAPEALKQEYRHAHENPKIIHYTDRGKPWLYPDEDLADVFWETARKTPFYETILFRLFDFQAQEKVKQIVSTQPNLLSSASVEFYPQGNLLKRTVKRIVRIFLPYGTKRRAFVKKYYFKLRGWEC